MTDDDNSELEALRYSLFGPANPNPITPGGRITLSEVAEFSQNWQRTRGRTDADIATDPNGDITVGESYPVQCAGLAISQADADRLGIHPNVYPGILIIPTPTKGTTS